MIYTKTNAKRLLAAMFPGVPLRFTTSTQIICRPVYEVKLGLKSVAYQALAKGADSAVRVGSVEPGEWINWSFSIGENAP